MGTIKDEKDKLVGGAKEKFGELTKNEELSEEGKSQKEDAEKNLEQRKKRIEELENLHDEKQANIQDGTKDQVGRDLEEHAVPMEEDLKNKDRLEEERLKHYTGIEEKL